MIISTKIPKGESHYLRQMRAAIATGRKRGRHAPAGQLGDLAGPLDALLAPAKAAVSGQLGELRAGLTLAAAASTAAALGVVLLLFRTGRNR